MSFAALGIAPCQRSDCESQPWKDCNLHEYNAMKLFDYLTYAQSEIQKLISPGHGNLPVDIVAHSMGGITTRVMISGYGSDAIKNLVRKVVFIATPQAGSTFASGALGWLGTELLEWGDLTGAQYLSLSYMRRINKKHGECGASKSIPFYYVTARLPYAGWPLINPRPNDPWTARQSALDCRVDSNPFDPFYKENLAFRLLAQLIELPPVKYPQVTGEHSEILGEPEDQETVWRLLREDVPDVGSLLPCPSPRSCEDPGDSAHGPTASSTQVPRLVQSFRNEGVPGNIYSHSHTIDSSGESVFSLMWAEGDLRLTLRDPLGRVIDPPVSGTDPNIEYSLDDNKPMPLTGRYTVSNPTAGTWWTDVEVVSAPDNQNKDYVAQSSSEGAPELTILVPPDPVQQNGTSIIAAELDEDGTAITGATVNCHVVDRLGQVSQIPMLDDGLGSDQTGNDGIYSAEIGPLAVSGFHRLEIVADGSRSDAQAFSRTVFSAVDVESVSASFDDVYVDRLVDTGGGPEADILAIDIDVTVTGSGDYFISGSLTDFGNQFVGNARLDAGTLGPGSYTLTLEYEGTTIRESGLDGPYLVTDLTLENSDESFGICDARAQAHQTEPYTATDFEPRDSDEDGIPDSGDNCDQKQNATQIDVDSDGLGDECDNCPFVSNVSQSDGDGDGFGDLCDLCPSSADPVQSDFDNDGTGDGCDNDADSDGVTDGSDCNPLNPSVWFIPTEVAGVSVAADKQTISWNGQTSTDGTTVTYDVAKGLISDLRLTAAFLEAICPENMGVSTQTVDGYVPPSSDAFYYMVRARTICGVGTYGSGAVGERLIAACP